MMGYETPQELMQGIGDVSDQIYVHPQARVEYQRLMRRDGMVREFEYQVRARDGRVALALRQRHRRPRRDRRDRAL